MSVTQQKDTLTLVIQKAIEEALSNTHTSTIAVVTKITGSTISAKPVFKRVIGDTEVELPEFAEIPIFTLQGGSNYRAMPIVIGDTALLIFSERCIDDWYHGSDNKRPREYRMHDYSDAIAVVGLNNKNKGISIPVGYEEVKGDIEHTGKNTQTGDYDLTGLLTQIGNFMQTGAITSSGLITGSGFKAGTSPGVSGTFLSADAKTITVTNGIITSIV